MLFNITSVFSTNNNACPHRKSGQMKITLIGFFVIVVDVLVQYQKMWSNKLCQELLLYRLLFVLMLLLLWLLLLLLFNLYEYGKMWSYELCQELLLGLKIWSSLFFETPTSFKLEFVFTSKKKQICLKWSYLCLYMQCRKSIRWFDQPM